MFAPDDDASEDDLISEHNEEKSDQQSSGDEDQFGSSSDDENKNAKNGNTVPLPPIEQRFLAQKTPPPNFKAMMKLTLEQ